MDREVVTYGDKGQKEREKERERERERERENIPSTLHTYLKCCQRNLQNRIH